MQVGAVQQKFVLQMLSFSNFNKHLSAVRETHAIVKRASELSKGHLDEPMQQTSVWLRSHNVVGQLLRANLHQKQYVDQVRQALNGISISAERCRLLLYCCLLALHKLTGSYTHCIMQQFLPGCVLAYCLCHDFQWCVAGPEGPEDLGVCRQATARAYCTVVGPDREGQHLPSPSQ